MKKLKLPNVPRILVTRTDRIGDLVVSTPIFRALREKFHHAHIAACVFLEHRELVIENPNLDEVILYDKHGREKNWLGQFKFAREISNKNFDIVIHLHATNRMHVMSWLAEIPTRIGYDRRAPWALTRVHPYDKKEGHRHEGEYLFDLLKDFEIKQPAVLHPKILVSAKARLSLQNLLEHLRVSDNKKLAVVHPSASDVTKMWPAEKFAELIKSMESRRGLSLAPKETVTDPSGSFFWIAIGDAKASEQTQKIAQGAGVPIVNLCGKLSLGMLAALFEKAELIISNDSGPAHIAAAVGAPTVSIFGRWQPGLNAERWSPLGTKTAIVMPQIEAISVEERKFTYIDKITVEQVLDAVQKVLA